MNKVFRGKKELTLAEIIYESDFAGITEEEMAKRLSGNHCACGDGHGEFTLLSANDPDVIEGGKRYMVCRKCVCYSHL